jgi:DhnA family fructose-bisphosphate aldolase class Ia
MSRMKLGDKALVVAMDHARTLGVVAGLEDPGLVLDRVLDAGADAVMTSYGVIKKYRDKLLGRVPTFLRLDGGPTPYLEEWLHYTQWSLLHTVDDARRLGVDGVCLMGFMGAEVEMTTYEIVARVVGDCAADGLPVMVETLPCPNDRIPDANDAGAMASASRIGFELGADIIKTYYTGSPESFRRVTSTVPAPVLIAGGGKMNTARAALDVVHGSIEAGGKGVVFGRNIWQNPDPSRIVAAMKYIIHEGATVSNAMRFAGVPG